MAFSRENRALGALGAAVLALATAAAPGCSSGGAEGGGGPDSKPVTVELVRVEPELLRDVEIFGGQLDAEFSVLVKPETDGIVASIEFEEGQRVSEGDVLVRLRDEEQKARLSEARANLALAGEVDARTRELVTRNVSSLAQRDHSAAELSVARARVELAELAFDRTQIRAPFDGVLGTRMVSPGDRVTDEVPLVKIDKVDRLQLTFPVSEHGVRYGRVGAPIELRVGPYPGETFPGEVYYVSPTLDAATRRVILKAWVPNDHGRLRSGLFADVELEIDRRENALVLPESALVYDREGTYVWRVDGEGKAERVPIELGLRRRGRVEVTLGLRPGDQVVSAGTHKVSAGNLLAAKPRTSVGRAQGPVETSAGQGT